MSKTFYVLAKFDIDQHNDHPWMTSTPFYQSEFYTGPGVELCMLSDIHWNHVAPAGAILRFSLYKITVNTGKEFLQKRQILFDKKNFSPSNVANLGFVKLVDFAYEVDEANSTQTTSGYRLNMSYHKDDKMFDGKYYLSNPSIHFD